MKIKLIEENNDLENLANENPLFLLSDNGTYMLNISFQEIEDILIGEGYDAPTRVAVPQLIVMNGLLESVKRRQK